MDTHNSIKDRLVVIAAGSSSRWNNYKGTTKHLVEVDGESILQRQVRLFDMDTTVIGFNEDYKVDGAELIIPDKVGGQDVNKQTYGTADLWNKNGRTIITLGDIYFTDEAIQTIKDYKEQDLHFFGRENGGVTCDYGELFAHSFYPEQHEDYLNSYMATNAMYEDGPIKRNEWWEQYRVAQGLDPTVHATGDMFTEINDLTDDFDYPKDFDLFMKAKNN